MALYMYMYIDCGIKLCCLLTGNVQKLPLIVKGWALQNLMILESHVPYKGIEINKVVV